MHSLNFILRFKRQRKLSDQSMSKPSKIKSKL